MSKVYIYVVRYDLGFAPNPFDGVCTLACCKPRIRRTAKVGDWIIGMGGRDLKATGRCIYLMQVTDHLGFNEYWEAERFRGKRPIRNGSRRTMVGDNIYHRGSDGSSWLQENSVHSQQNGEQDVENTERDTHVNRVLISREFFYFGENAPTVPPEFLEAIGYRNRPDHRVFKNEDCQSLLDWIKGESRGQVNHVLGDPFQFRMSGKRYSKSRNKLI